MRAQYHTQALDPEPYRTVIQMLWQMGVSGRAMAEEAGVSPETIYRILDGNATRIQQRTAEKLRSLVELFPETA